MKFECLEKLMEEGKAGKVVKDLKEGSKLEKEVQEISVRTKPKRPQRWRKNGVYFAPMPMPMPNAEAMRY